MLEQTTAPTHRIVDGVALTEYTPTDPRHDETLVFVHGGCHGSWMWEGMQGWFAERGWRSVAIDWFSHGDSRQLPREEWLQRGIPAVRDEIGIACRTVGGPTVVIAHSMGGLASQAYAATAPETLRALVILTPVVPGVFATEPVDAFTVDLNTLWGPPPPEIARQLFYSGVDDDTAARFYPKLQPESPQAVTQATRWTVELDLSGINVPVFAVGAEKDLLVRAAYIKALAAEIGADYLELPGVGHGVPMDPGWDQLSDRIETWLSSALR